MATQVRFLVKAKNPKPETNPSRVRFATGRKRTRQLSAPQHAQPVSKRGGLSGKVCPPMLGALVRRHDAVQMGS